MRADPQPAQSKIEGAAEYRPDPAILQLADWLGDKVEPAYFPETKLRFRNDRAAASVGLDQLSDEDWARHFGRFEPLSGNLPHPLALRYHGHQFRVYNPEIGDGYWTSPDGLTLHYRDYPGPDGAADKAPIICMHGPTLTHFGKT